MVAMLKYVYYVLGICQQDPDVVVLQIKNKYLDLYNITESEILDILDQRTKCKENKDFKGADRIKNLLLSRNIEVKDGRNNSVDWDFIIK